MSYNFCGYFVLGPKKSATVHADQLDLRRVDTLNNNVGENGNDGIGPSLHFFFLRDTK